MTCSCSNLLDLDSFLLCASPFVLQTPNKPQPVQYWGGGTGGGRDGTGLIVFCQQSAQISGGMFTMLIWVSRIYSMQRGLLDTRESKPHLNSVLQ